MENSMAVLSKILKTELPYDLAISLLGIYSKELKTEFWTDILYTHVYRNIDHKSQKGGSNPSSTVDDGFKKGSL